MSDLELRNQIDRRLRFISDLVLPPPVTPIRGLLAMPEATAPLPSATGKDVAAVLDDSLVSFTDGLSDQNRDDVMDSLHFMQLAATARYDKVKEHEQWYKFYHEGLNTVGWLTTAHGFQSYSPSQQTFTMDEVAIEIIGLVGGAGFARVAIAAAAALNRDQKALQLFENSNQSEDASSFKMLPCIQTERGDVSMVLNFMTFTKTVKTRRVLFWKFSSSDVRIFRGAEKIQLNASLYASLRSTVKERLSEKGRDFIAGLEL